MPITMKRPVLDKLRPALADLIEQKHPRADRFAEYLLLIESAINEGRADEAANLGWEAAHLWLHAE